MQGDYLVVCSNNLFNYTKYILFIFFLYESRQPPLEYIDRSIQNISKGLYSNASQIEQLNTQLDSITERLSSMNFNEHSNDFVSQQIEHETRKSTIPVKFSAEAEEKTNQIIKKEWKLFKFSNINKSKRKIPYGTNLYSDIEPGGVITL